MDLLDMRCKISEVGPLPKDKFGHFGLWLSLVERLVRDQEAVGSNPTSPISTNLRLSSALRGDSARVQIAGRWPPSRFGVRCPRRVGLSLRSAFILCALDSGGYSTLYPA